MAEEYNYKVRNGVKLVLGDSSNEVEIAGGIDTGDVAAEDITASGDVDVTGDITADTIAATELYSYEKVTTTGTDDVVDPAFEVSLITSAGAHTVTLADGTMLGQCKQIVLSVDGGTVTLTPAHLADGTSITLADVLDSVKLLWDGTNWNIIESNGLAIVA